MSDSDGEKICFPFFFVSWSVYPFNCTQLGIELRDLWFEFPLLVVYLKVFPNFSQGIHHFVMRVLLFICGVLYLFKSCWLSVLWNCGHSFSFVYASERFFFLLSPFPQHINLIAIHDLSKYSAAPSLSSPSRITFDVFADEEPARGPHIAFVVFEIGWVGLWLYLVEEGQVILIIALDRPKGYFSFIIRGGGVQTEGGSVPGVASAPHSTKS